MPDITCSAYHLNCHELEEKKCDGRTAWPNHNFKILSFNKLIQSDKFIIFALRKNTHSTA